jgi:hypothetical protein
MLPPFLKGVPKVFTAPGRFSSVLNARTGTKIIFRTPCLAPDPSTFNQLFCALFSRLIRQLAQCPKKKSL